MFTVWVDANDRRVWRQRGYHGGMLTSFLPVLGNPLYRRYMLGNGLSLLGLWVHRVGLGWLTWELTQSGFWLGVVAFADLFPAIVIGPFAGVWADPWLDEGGAQLGSWENPPPERPCLTSLTATID